MNMLESYRLNDVILCIDLKSFFASVECVLRGKNPLQHLLLVADESRGKGTIVLAVSPPLKAYGIPSRCRLWEVEKKLKGQVKYEIAKPRMQKYINYNKKVINIYLKYVNISDMYVYSIDECFLDLTSYINLYKKSPREIAQMILDDIYRSLGIYATCGIGKNMVMAKFALDLASKHQADFIAEWDYDTFQKPLWSITKLTDVWGIGQGRASRLQGLGVKSMYDLAHIDINRLYAEFGKLGDELFMHAHCLDMSKVQDKYQLQKRKGYGVGQTLFQSYFNEDILTILFEQCQELGQRMRIDNKAGSVLSVGIGYSYEVKYKSFYKQQKLMAATNNHRRLFEAAQAVFHRYYKRHAGVRRISLSVTGLVTYQSDQLDLFQDTRHDEYVLDKTIDHVNQKFGKSAVLTGANYVAEANQRERNTMIGGHKS